MTVTFSRLALAITLVAVTCTLYFVFRFVGIPAWMSLTLVVSLALSIASFAQAATFAGLSQTRWHRSPSMRRFWFDFAWSILVAVPAALTLRARFLYLMYGPSAVFKVQSWLGWLGSGGSIETLLVMFVFMMGIASLACLFINRFFDE